MLRDRVRYYFLDCDCNCAESMLRLLNEYYNLGIADFKIISGFGGGCGCGLTCGALAGCIAAIGEMKVEGRAHITPGFKELCGEFCGEFEKALGSTACSCLRPKYFKDNIRCSEALELAADCFESFAKNHGMEPR